jgi:hypothetical protein
MDFVIELLKYGGPTAAISIIGYFILKEVFKYLRTRDESFVGLISNHLKDNTESNNQLKQVVAELITFLKRKNGN